MKPILPWLVAFVGVLGPLGYGRAQETVLFQQQGAAGQMELIPESSPANLQAPLFLAPDAATGVAAVGNGGFGANNFGDVQIGFDFLQPLWTFRDFMLAVPSAQVGNFPVLGDTGHVDNHFGFAPNLKYNYQIAALDLGFSGTGTFLNLTGQLHREVAAAGGASGQLDANSTLTIIVANVPEFTKHLEYRNLNRRSCLYCDCLEKLLIDVSIGLRYTSISQNYTGSLTSSAAGMTNQTTRSSTQSLSGVGLTGSVHLAHPLADNWFLYQQTRASLLVADDKKASTLTVNVAGQPGLSTTITQNDTMYLPAVEMELGLEWYPAPINSRLSYSQRPFLVYLKTAMVGQFWGRVGPLSAGSSQAFRDSDLFLVGANVMLGFRY